MKLAQLLEDYEISQKIYLYNQPEISTDIEDREFYTSDYGMYHGFEMPKRYKIGHSVADGNCFFDSFRQGLNPLDISVTVDKLRESCKEFALKSPPDWFITGISNSHDNTGQVRTETLTDYVRNILDINRWGDPEIEGRVLCIKYNVNLYLIEKQIVNSAEIYTSVLINKNGSRSVGVDFYMERLIIIVNLGNGHFEPLIDTLLDNLKCTYDYVKIKNNRINCRVAQSSTNKIKKKLLKTVNSLEATISKGDIGKLKELVNYLYRVDKDVLSNSFKDSKNTLRNTNLVVLACKYNQLDILQYLLHQSNIIYHLPVSDEVNAYKFKEESFIHATQALNIDMLETLYDQSFDELHWSCNHQNKDVIGTLKELHVLLTKAWINSRTFIIKDMQMVVDVHCLLEFNKFQIELYTKLSKIDFDIAKPGDVRKAETEKVVEVMLTVLRIYENYNLKDIRMPNNVAGVETRMRKLLEDETSIYMRNHHEFMYDLYYRKLDSNVSLLILDNLHHLQQRLDLPSESYQEIESAIYYFIFRVYEDWRLYLPKHRVKSKVDYLVEIYNCQLNKASATYDQTKMLIGPLLYLNRKNFCDALTKFKNILETAVIKDQVRQKGKKLPVVEINSLPLLPMMRDNFSLKKILKYLNSLFLVDLDNDRDYSILMIERTIQVVGELFKTTNESIHLDSLTKSLLQLEIPSEIIEHFKDIRDFLSHVDKARLLRRIYTETKETDSYNQAVKDLKEIRARLYQVIDLYDPVIDKWIVNKGFSIINKRKKEIPIKNQHILKVQLLGLPSPYFADAFINYETKIMKKYNITRQLLREICTLNGNEDDLNLTLNSINEYLLHLVISKLQIFTDAIRSKLKYVEENYSTDTKCVKEWDFVIKLFEYIVIVAGFLDNNHYEIKRSTYSNLLENNIKTRSSNDSALKDAHYLLQVIENNATTYIFSHNFPVSSKTINENHDFPGIKALKTSFDKHYRFITDEELKYFLDDVQKSYGDKADKVLKDNEKIFKKIRENTPIPGTERKKICSLKLDDKSKRIIGYLDMGSKRGSELTYCFEKRINLLKHLLGDPRESVSKYVLRYKHDDKFRISLEMLLIDIMNILKHIKQIEALKKPTKLFTDANLRNILEHSEPLLEDIGGALDPNDFATELVMKALEYVDKAPEWTDALAKVKK